jgi:hypothetical protein
MFFNRRQGRPKVARKMSMSDLGAMDDPLLEHGHAASWSLHPKLWMAL